MNIQAQQSPKLKPTQNLNVQNMALLPSPREMEAVLPMTKASHQTVVQSRQVICDILQGRDSRLLLVIGPCSIHDVDAAIDYAKRLAALRTKIEDQIYIVMRVYFEKPRTTVGWKGLINDPHLDGSFDMTQGLKLARQLLLDITAMGLPTGTEVLDPITPQYIDDLITWAAIGARTIESQTHRQMASGLSMPVGFKNSTEGNLKVANQAMQAAQQSHSFLGIDEDGRTCVVTTRGNDAGHLILRGGHDGPNYEAKDVAQAVSLLEKDQLPTSLMIDCSHANSNKKFEQQQAVWNNLIEQRLAGQKEIVGAMIESNIGSGNQKIAADRAMLKYGVSITDECIDWEKTEEMLLAGAKQLASAK